MFQNPQIYLYWSNPYQQRYYQEDTEAAGNIPSERTAKEQLDKLFQQHPQLRGKLNAIYQETLDPRSRRFEVHQSRNTRFENYWTEEKGFEQGLRILKAKLETDSAHHEDLRAFAVFVSTKTENV